MKRSIVALCLVLLMVMACQLPQLSRFNLSNKIIQHPAPELQIDSSFFAGLGCFDSPACLPEKLQNLPHPIDYVSEPGDILGGLSPSLPIAVANTRGFTPEEEFPAVYVNRCMAQQYIRYVVSVENEVQLVDSLEGLTKIFAPIESPEEALSFAIASTGLSAVYDTEDIKKIKLYSDTVEETFITEVDNGYIVRLFDTYLCGCGPHIVSSVDVTVQRNGSIKLSDPVQAFSDPEYDGLCID